MIEPTAPSPIGLALPGMPPAVADSGGGTAAAPDFALTLTGLLAVASPSPVPTTATGAPALSGPALPKERQELAEPGTSLPVASPSDIGVPSAIPAAVSRDLATPSAQAAADRPEPRLEPALAWLMPPVTAPKSPSVKPAEEFAAARIRTRDLTGAIIPPMALMTPPPVICTTLPVELLPVCTTMPVKLPPIGGDDAPEGSDLPTALQLPATGQSPPWHGPIWSPVPAAPEAPAVQPADATVKPIVSGGAAPVSPDPVKFAPHGPVKPRPIPIRPVREFPPIICRPIGGPALELDPIVPATTPVDPTAPSTAADDTVKFVPSARRDLAPPLSIIPAAIVPASTDPVEEPSVKGALAPTFGRRIRPTIVPLPPLPIRGPGSPHVIDPKAPPVIYSPPIIALPLVTQPTAMAALVPPPAGAAYAAPSPTIVQPATAATTVVPVATALSDAPLPTGHTHVAAANPVSLPTPAGPVAAPAVPTVVLTTDQAIPAAPIEASRPAPVAPVKAAPSLGRAMPAERSWTPVAPALSPVAVQVPAGPSIVTLPPSRPVAQTPFALSRRRETGPVPAPMFVTVAPPTVPASLQVAATPDAQQAAIDLTRDPGLHRMIDRIEHLRDAADARDTRIRLIPDALGPVNVAVRRDGDAVRVHFTATEAATRQLIADAAPRLTELAETRGVRIERATVDAGLSGGASHGSANQPRSQHAAFTGPNRASAHVETDDNDNHRIA